MLDFLGHYSGGPRLALPTRRIRISTAIAPIATARSGSDPGSESMALAHAIMTALIDNDLSGYELARDFETSLGFFWHASHQQIYQELHKLAEKGWLNKREVHQSGKPNKIVYGMTKAGREALAEWILGASKSQVAKDELVIKLYNLSPRNAAHLAAEISERREQMMRLLYTYEKIRLRHYSDPRSLPTRSKGAYLALSRGLGHGQQFLAWCDEALELIATVERENP
jgi:DNA-binding PadR family transcriptional regulator